MLGYNGDALLYPETKPRTVSFTLPEPTPLLNVLMRKHYRVRSQNKRRTAAFIAGEIAGKMPAKPFEKARVTITRYSSGTPDDDGLKGGVKDLLDCLTTPKLLAGGKVKNKFGVGLIVDDSPAHCLLGVSGVKCKRADQRTEVLIEEIA